MHSSWDGMQQMGKETDGKWHIKVGAPANMSIMFKMKSNTANSIEMNISFLIYHTDINPLSVCNVILWISRTYRKCICHNIVQI